MCFCAYYSYTHVLVFSRFSFCLLSNFRLFLDSHDTAQEKSYYSKIELVALTLTWPHGAGDVLSYKFRRAVMLYCYEALQQTKRMKLELF